MSEWWPGTKVARVFAVGPEQLARYALRGNLAAKRLSNGETLYNTENVARLFPRRSDEPRAPRKPVGPTADPEADSRSFGDLGTLTLGPTAPTPQRGTPKP